MATEKDFTLRYNNGIDYDTYYPKTRGTTLVDSVPISRGGTGASDSSSAKKNLGIKENIIGNATLSTSGWTGSTAPYTYVLTVQGLLSTDTPIIWRVGTGDASADAITAAAWALCCAPVYEPDTAAGTLTIHASTKPTSNIPIHYEIVRGG